MPKLRKLTIPPMPGRFFFPWMAYFMFFDGTSGQMPSKRVTDIRVIKEDSSPVDFESVLVRTVL